MCMLFLESTEECKLKCTDQSNYLHLFLNELKLCIYIYIYVHCSKQLEEQTKKGRKPSETPMYWHTMDSTRVLMRNTEKRRKKYGIKL